MQQELSDSLHKLSVSEASLERNKHHLNVLQEDKAVLVKDVATLKEQVRVANSAFFGHHILLIPLLLCHLCNVLWRL